MAVSSDAIVAILMSPIKQQLLDAIDQVPDETLAQLLDLLPRLSPENPLQTLINNGRIIAPSGLRTPIDDTELQTFTRSLTGVTLSDLIIRDRNQW